MAAEKKKVVRITTPAGIAKYPKVQKADTKFNAAGVYSTGLIIPAAKCADLCAVLDAAAEEAYSNATNDPKKVAAAKAKKKTITKNDPYLPEVDAEGNETGNIVFKFKTNASAEVNGETKHFKPFLCDAANPPKPIVADINMYSGSVIKVNFSPAPYYNDANAQAGVSCRLNGVQVIRLVKGGYNAETFGFTAEEEGFDFADGTPAGPAADAPSDGTPAADAVAADAGKPASDF